MAAEPANEDSVARHLARRELLNDLARYRAKARGNLSFYAKSMCAVAHAAKAVADFTRSPPCFRGFRKSIGARAKTKVWGSPNQYDIQINLRRMEQFVLVNLSCHSWLEPGVAGKRDLIDSNVTEAEGHVD
jgi:hypothetical protein